jgi:hypothetical protein
MIETKEDVVMTSMLIHPLQPLVLITGIATLLCAAGQVAAGDWQEKMLFNPPDSQLKLEQRGRIMIYDGLTDKQVAMAMDAQFDRIESMMFVRTIVTNDEGNAVHDNETGQVIVEDDGC